MVGLQTNDRERTEEATDPLDNVHRLHGKSAPQVLLIVVVSFKKRIVCRVVTAFGL